MKKRTLFLSVMALLLSAALCGCSGGKDTEASEPVKNSSEAAPAGSAESPDLSAEASETVVEAETAEPVSGGSAVVGVTHDLVSLDPHQSTDARTRSVVFNLYEGLVKPDADGNLVPAVASDYEISDDATVYTFTLRDGVKFHDGSTVTAEDVKYSIERYAGIQGESSAFSVFDHVEIPDEKTVKVYLKEGYSEFLPEITFGIIPKSNADPEKNPIGTGPFKYVSYTPGQRLEVEKFEDYWQEGLPYLDHVEFKITADNDTAFMELQAGTIDILDYLTGAQVKAVGDDCEVLEGTQNMVQGMFLNHTYEPLANQKVRQAICYAVNKDEINGFLYDGKSHLIGSHMIPKLVRYYEPEAEGMYPYDAERAKELLAEAGYPDGFDLEIIATTASTQYIDAAQIIADQLTRVGIRATIRQVEWSTWLDEVYHGKQFQATVVGFDGSLAPNYWMKRYVTGNSKNFMNYSNSEYDETYKNALMTVDDGAKAELYKKCQMILAEDAESVFIQDPANYVAVNKRLGGYQFYPLSAQDMSVVYEK